MLYTGCGGVVQPRHMGERVREATDERSQLMGEQGGRIVHQSTNARVTVRETCTSVVFENVVEGLALIECVQKKRERADIEPHRAIAQEVIADPRQLGDDHS